MNQWEYVGVRFHLASVGVIPRFWESACPISTSDCYWSSHSVESKELSMILAIKYDSDLQHPRCYGYAWDVAPSLNVSFFSQPWLTRD